MRRIPAHSRHLWAGCRGGVGCAVVATDPPPAARNTEPHMRAITRKVVSFLKQEEGPTAVEYAVMLALIIVVCIAAITTFGKNTNSTFSFVGSTLTVR